MNELGPDARSILDAAREGDEPDARDRRRVRAALAQKLGLGAAVVSASVVTATTAKASVVTASTAKSAVVWSSSYLFKLAMVAGAVSLAASGGVLAVRYVKHRDAASDASSAWVPTSAHAASGAVSSSAASQSGPPADEPPLETKSAPIDSPPIALVVVATPSIKPFASSLAPTPSSSASPSSSAKPDTLQAELSLLGAAQAALAAGDAEKALAILDEHADRFPHGTLAEERSGARCIALCMAGRPDARLQAEAFSKRHPDSPLRARIDKACALTTIEP